MYKLRPYQEEAVKAGVEFMNSNLNEGAIIVAPTASGKSLIIANIARQLDGNILILQPSKELLEQNYEKMLAYGETDIGIYSASMGRKDIGKITFATVGSIYKKKELFNDFSHLLIDEAQLTNAKFGMYKQMIDFFGGKVIGLTATPYRMHSYRDMNSGMLSVVAKFLNRTRPKLFKKIIHLTQISDLYEQGFLCPVEYSIYQGYDRSQIKLNSTGLGFDEKSLKIYNESVEIVEVVKRCIEKENSKHILVFLSSVAEAESLRDRLNLIGISSGTISAETPKKERAEILRQFKEGEIKVVSNCQTMTVGYDFPELDCCILARPTQSIALFQQMIGRVLRIAPDKKIARVIDLCGNVNKFGRIETFSIIFVNGLPRLKSNSSFLTGFDFFNNIDLENTDYKNKVEVEYSKGDIIPFGKFKGTHVTKLPSYYLDWALNAFDDGKIKQMLLNEKNRRLN